MMAVCLQEWLLGVCITLLLAWPSASDGKLQAPGSATCERYDRAECINDSQNCTPTVVDCNNMITNPTDHKLCFASWIITPNSEPELVKKDCWINQNDCYNQPKCVDSRVMATVYFCCCDGDMCNKEYHHIPELSNTESDLEEDPEGDPGEYNFVRHASEHQLANTLLYSIVPILGLVCVVVLLFLIWRRHQRHLGHTQLPTVDPALAITPSQSSLNLQLLELRARGRYGSLWKAQLADKFVAVKIFPLQDKQSWKAELDIYNLPCMKHENVLKFIASDKKDEQCTELWLITEFHERGSLCDYLKAHTVTWAQLCKIGESMTCGLAYLHDESPATYSSAAKPAIAHRDLKSKNVLLKSDLTACIADFGLALMLESGKAFDETHPQVGTRRYMAPEVLEGAICFNRDSFLRIDMYACGLIIWELMSRCNVIEGPVEEYRLPFEAEVGLQPSLEKMQTLVVTQKCRPAIHQQWWEHTGLCTLISTVEECWDQDAEARLSAGCVQERISQLSRTVNSSDSQPPPPPDFSSLPPPAPVSLVPNSVVIGTNGPGDYLVNSY